MPSISSPFKRIVWMIALGGFAVTLFAFLDLDDKEAEADAVEACVY